MDQLECPRIRARIFGLAALLATATSKGTGDGSSSANACPGTCTGSGSTRSCSFTAKVDIFASSTGYFKFNECGDTSMPVLEMERDVQYIFYQNDVSNWYHPLGFAYAPDGAHNDEPELEPSVTMSGSTCADDNTCQAPQYFLGKAFLGEHTGKVNYPDAANIGDFGLDKYEPTFGLGRADWIASRDDNIKHGGWRAKLILTDTTFTGDLYYFCHIHGMMSGRIKVLSPSGVHTSIHDTHRLPEKEYPSPFDIKCGTYGLKAYEGNQTCPTDYFFCGETPEAGKTDFNECLHALDCAMHVEMRVDVRTADPVTAFMQQMIPHHDNAVNMAKTLLKTGGITEALDPDGDVETLMWDIINNQNSQIHFMRSWLSANEKKSPKEARCARSHGMVDGLNNSGVILVALLAIVSAVCAALIVVLLCIYFPCGATCASALQPTRLAATAAASAGKRVPVQAQQPHPGSV